MSERGWRSLADIALGWAALPEGPSLSLTSGHQDSRGSAEVLGEGLEDPCRWLLAVSPRSGFCTPGHQRVRH